MSWRLHVCQGHGYIPHPKYFQDFGSAERNQRTNHKFISKYYVQNFFHAGNLSFHCYTPLAKRLPNYMLSKEFNHYFTKTNTVSKPIGFEKLKLKQRNPLSGIKMWDKFP